MNGDLREARLVTGGRCRDQSPWLAAEGDGRQFLDTRHGDDDQRDQQQRAERQRDAGADDKIVSVPVGENRGRPGADHIGGGRQHDGLAEGDCAH